MCVKKALIGLTLSMLLGSGVAVAADVDQGLKAYESGDYKTAIVFRIPRNPTVQDDEFGLVSDVK